MCLSVLQPSLYRMEEMISSVADLSPDLSSCWEAVTYPLQYILYLFFPQRMLSLEPLLLNDNGFV